MLYVAVSGAYHLAAGLVIAVVLSFFRAKGMLDPEETAQGFVDAAALHEWFAANHASADELWVRLYKKASGQSSVDWDDFVAGLAPGEWRGIHVQGPVPDPQRGGGCVSGPDRR